MRVVGQVLRILRPNLSVFRGYRLTSRPKLGQVYQLLENARRKTQREAGLFQDEGTCDNFQY